MSFESRFRVKPSYGMPVSAEAEVVQMDVYLTQDFTVLRFSIDAPACCMHMSRAGKRCPSPFGVPRHCGVSV